MPIFEYKAYNIYGKVYHSHLESTSLPHAKSKLSELNIPFVYIREKKLYAKKKVKKETLLQFTEQLAQLLEAGLPLYESLGLLKEQFQGDPFFNILDQLVDSLKAGISFSKALKKFPDIFNPFFCALVEMGEESGHLEEALDRLSIELKREYKITKHIQSALLYPSILMGFCFILINILIFYIVPSIESLFESSSTNLFTQIVVSFCHHLKRFEIIYFSFLILFLIAFKSLYRRLNFRKKIDFLFLEVPILKALLKEIAFARWTSTMAMLLKAGITLIEALKLSSNLLQNYVLKQALKECESKVKEGAHLSSELKKNNLFPSLLIRMIYVGESSGELTSSFDKLATLYEEGVDKKMAKLMTLLSPILLVGMALFIGAIMLAILIPLTDINSFSL